MKQPTTSITLYRSGVRISAATLFTTDREEVCHAAASLLLDEAFTTLECDEARLRFDDVTYRITRVRVLAAQAQEFAGLSCWADLAEEIE
jgi:hypothetical protein